MKKALWTEGVMWDNPIDLSYPIRHKSDQPQCFDANLPSFEPYQSGDYIGSIEKGSPVNFYNIHINPHGTATHTECYGHIKNGHTILDCVQKFLYNAFLSVAEVSENENGDRLIQETGLKMDWPEDTEALIVKTEGIKAFEANFSGKNPVYFSPEAIKKINATGIRHILTEWPSLDREQDGGALAAHKAFWLEEGSWQKDKTITELIVLPENIREGKYVLSLQVLAIDLDVSPSRPVLYSIES